MSKLAYPTIDLEKALRGAFVDEGEDPEGFRRISVLLPISKEDWFNCHRAVVYLMPKDDGLHGIEKIRRFRLLCIGCGDDRMEEVDEMHGVAEGKLREYLKDAAP